MIISEMARQLSKGRSCALSGKLNLIICYFQKTRIHTNVKARGDNSQDLAILMRCLSASSYSQDLAMLMSAVSKFLIRGVQTQQF